ncbi:MAG: hypothetical protein JW839_01270 [Candidatus Lokiarchaeota archaeon]|nr:hypothetical protein [Candidatus Lokiarchaeota archaeon]
MAAGDDARGCYGDLLATRGENLGRIVAIPIQTWLLFLAAREELMASIAPGGPQPNMDAKCTERGRYDRRVR